MANLKQALQALGAGSSFCEEFSSIFSKPVAVYATNGRKGTYSADFKAFNQSFAKWMQQYLDKNPVCLLALLFDDYRKYFKKLEDKKNKKSAVGASKTAASKSTFTPVV